MSSSADCRWPGTIDNLDSPMVPAHRQGRAELTFVRRGGRTVLAHSRATAPMTLVRPFALGGGRQLVQLITLGPGYCGGDRVQIQITAEEGADAVVTTTAATRVLSMRPGADAAQDVRIFAGRGATVQYYPLPTIPFPDSAFAQTLTVDADPTARVGALETFAMGRTARDEYLAFRTLASRTTLMVAGAPIYVDATELDPGATALAGIGVLAGRRYLASGFWYGLTIAETPREGAGCGDVLTVFAASRPGLSYLRALASDGPALDGVLREAIGRVAAAWGYPPLALDRYRC